MFRYYTRVCLRKISKLITEYFSKSRNWKTSFTIRSLKSFWHQSFLFHQLISTLDQHQYFPASARLRLSSNQTFQHFLMFAEEDRGLQLSSLTLVWMLSWHWWSVTLVPGHGADTAPGVTMITHDQLRLAGVSIGETEVSTRLEESWGELSSGWERVCRLTDTREAATRDQETERAGSIWAGGWVEEGWVMLPTLLLTLHYHLPAAAAELIGVMVTHGNWGIHCKKSKL